MMKPEPAIDLAGAVFATMWYGSALDFAISAVLGVDCHWRVEGMRSRGKARDEPTIVRVRLRQKEDRERRWTALGVAGVQLLHRYRGESDERAMKSVREGVCEYCEGVVQENEDGYRVRQKTQSTETTHLGTILHAVEKVLWYSPRLNRRTSRSIALE
ncbi:hypothetical protein DFJ58DRAFT_913921 [Suillus subalutaceus]|uniref:uncharacterized protein n=1 Tax=Suillus subalutaceus TaxID=48586 RepID=UPI001B86D805|nr:uncharacterized protein DFJ58DRAFT_913921 [Suillus subalutaceus]KAG1855209.1 hypothetical protein DFJ58DRAFT_913921 [Suillus subalutaceus]